MLHHTISWQRAMASVDGPAFVAAAVRAACLAKAPRRTVQAVVAADTGVFAHPSLHAAPRAGDGGQAKTLSKAAAAATGASPEQLVAALQAARRARRQRRKGNKKIKAKAKADAAVLSGTLRAGAFAEQSGDELSSLGSFRHATDDEDEDKMEPQHVDAVRIPVQDDEDDVEMSADEILWGPGARDFLTAAARQRDPKWTGPSRSPGTWMECAAPHWFFCQGGTFKASVCNDKTGPI